jgi:feruloyl-CoA synthase
VVVRDGAPGVRNTLAEQALKEHPARADRPPEALGRYAPERTFMARRVKRADGSSGDWRHVTTAKPGPARAPSRKALINRGLSAERPVVILSENDLEHALLALGCLVAGVPYVPTSPAVLAGQHRLRQAAPRARDGDAGPGVRRRRRALWPRDWRRGGPTWKWC